MRTYLHALTMALIVTAGLAADDKPRYAGPSKGGFLLPNGWTITPAGKQVILSDLPLNILPLADGQHALVATSGFNPHELSLVDLDTARVLDRQEVLQSWFGLATNANEDTVWWAGGGAGMIHTFNLKGGQLNRTGPDEPNIREMSRDEVRALKGFRTGLTLTPNGNHLVVLDIEDGALSLLNPTDQVEVKKVAIGGKPYDVVFSRNGTQLFVSDWAGRAVLVIDPGTLQVIRRIPVGEHPNQIARHPSDDRLFVACASSNTVAVIDTGKGRVTETISTTLFPHAPEGSTPDAVAVAPDGRTLFVANADNNCVAVIDIATPNQSAIKGFVPTGWYPTAVNVTPDGKHLLVGVGKGNRTQANPKFKKDELLDNPLLRRLGYRYIGTTLSGALSIVPMPDDDQLKEYTATVYRNCPYSDKLLTQSPHPEKTAVPTIVGEPSPIKHIIYVIKENRTYDQVFGDVPEGNGDPELVMFGEKVTPNHHKLARDFVLLDNLYCNGQVSRDGHPWSTSAYNTDYTARNWHLTYSGRQGVDDDDEQNLGTPPSGYLWDACARAGLSYRSYGEYGKRVTQPDGTQRMEGRVPGLVGHMCPDYRIDINGQRMRDPANVEVFLKEFREFEKNNNLPRFIVMSLGEDHTRGTTPGQPTPEACVASNDLALGKLVDAVTKSKYWKQTAIFVIEDDAQNGPDHVDAHRTVGLVISPYTKRKFVDSTQYSTVSMIRTMELILGLPPLSQYDAAARPMFNSFTAKADLTPYTHLPAKIDLNQLNTTMSYGAERSQQMDFSDFDRINDFELNEILWRAVKGRDAPMPAPVRRAIAFRSLTAAGQ